MTEALFTLDEHRIRRGFALVIVNKKYEEGGSQLTNRPSAENDKIRAINFCRKAGCSVNHTYGRATDDLTAQDMKNLFEKISQRDFTSYDAFICFISGHGNRGGIYGVDGEIISVGEIISYFKEVRTLVDKPKLFFLQNCRGSKPNMGLVAADDPGEAPTPMHLPIKADILIAYATVHGYRAYRTSGGSLFITALTEVLQRNASHMNLTDILAIVNKRVAELQVAEGEKQMPCFTSTLRKCVYFTLLADPAEHP